MEVQTTEHLITSLDTELSNSKSSSSSSCPPCHNNLRNIIEGGVVTASSFLFYEVFHNPMCGIVFRCGCQFNPWLGGSGWLLCNVHNPSLDSIRCPWCLSPRDTPMWTWTTSRTCIVILMVMSWLFIGWRLERKQSWKLVKRESCRIRRRLAPILWFLVHHAFSGLIFALATGYPYWFFITFPNHQQHSAPLNPVLPNVTDG